MFTIKNKHYQFLLTYVEYFYITLPIVWGYKTYILKIAPENNITQHNTAQ